MPFKSLGGIKMLKETIICIVIAIAIIFGNNVTQNYTKESIQELSGTLQNLREDLLKGQVENDNLENGLKKIERDWKKRHDILAFYIEHNELEKIETGLTAMKSYIKTKKYEDSISEVDKSIFLLKHIEDKYSFNLQNIL